MENTPSLGQRQAQWEQEYKGTLNNLSQLLSTVENNGKFDQPIKRFLEENIPPQSNILDIGSGLFPVTYIPEGSHVFPVDISPSAVQGKENEVIADAEHLPFCDGCFPVVLCKEVYSYIPNPENLISEMLRVLQKGGLFVLINAEGEISNNDPSKMWLHDFDPNNLLRDISPHFEQTKEVVLKTFRNFKLPNGKTTDINIKAILAVNYQGKQD